jgi:hypothetical protein
MPSRLLPWRLPAGLVMGLLAVLQGLVTGPEKRESLVQKNIVQRAIYNRV